MNIFENIVITNVESIFTVLSAKGRYEEIKNRKYYGLSFCEEGQITYLHKGKEYVSDVNHAVVLPKGENYCLYGDKKGIFPVINFSCINHLSDSIEIIPVHDIESYLKDFEQMKNLFLFEKNRNRIMSILYGMIFRLTTSYDTNEGMLAHAIKYLENNYSDSSLTNAKLAQLCNISEVYFRKLFCEQYGISPKQYIIDIRIGKAKQLLSEGILKVNAIAEMCGFTNQYHFCRVFKEKVGVAPTEYMKKNRIFKI